MLNRTIPLRLLALLCLVAGLMPSGLHATSLLPPRFEALVDEAELIFTGQVIAQRCEWRNIQGQKSIVTLVTLGVQATHKGRAGATVTLQLLGGTVGDVSLEVSEMPKFKTGERAVVFVEKNGTQACPILGWQHGRFGVQKAEGGPEMIFKPDGAALAEVGEIGQAKRAARPAAQKTRGLSHEEFAGKIRERLARGGGK